MEPRDLLGHDDGNDRLVARCVAVTRRFRTPSGDVVALDRVDLAVQPGAITVIAGPSGSGKSTLLGILGCMERPDVGLVELEGVLVDRLSRRRRRVLRRRRLGIMLPDPSDNLLDRLDATGNVRWAARLRGTALDDAAVVALLEPLGLAVAAHRRVRQLSGGEQQRVALACAVAGSPAMVLCDEPTASLDRASARTVVAAMRTVADRGATVVVASHDPDVIAAADQVVRLDHGRVVEP